MKTLDYSSTEVNTSRPYSVLVGCGLLERIGELLDAKNLADRHIVVVTNPTVAGFWLKSLRKGLTGVRFDTLFVADGEEHKSLASASMLYDRLVERGVGRDGVILAFGGGVIGDLAGFVASTYMRGIGFVQVPTTLLAQVDASVGGKVAVDHPGGKNLIGAFYQPEAVFCDLGTLATLSDEVYRAGVAEAVKTALIAGEGFFGYLQTHADGLRQRDPKVLAQTVQNCVQTKATIVCEDEHDTGLRMSLNLGHTFAHAIEAAAHYKNVSHGDAVSVGLSMALALGRALGLTPGGLSKRVSDLQDALGLPKSIGELGLCITENAFYAGLKTDKKRLGGALRFVIPYSIGDVRTVSGISESETKSVVKAALDSRTLGNTRTRRRGF